jgi:hypothetical protein
MSRTVLALNPGAPNAPVCPLPGRVSTTRQGVTATKLSGALVAAFEELSVLSMCAVPARCSRIRCLIVSTMEEVGAHWDGTAQFLRGTSAAFCANAVQNRAEASKTKREVAKCVNRPSVVL